MAKFYDDSEIETEVPSRAPRRGGTSGERTTALAKGGQIDKPVETGDDGLLAYLVGIGKQATLNTAKYVASDVVQLTRKLTGGKEMTIPEADKQVAETYGQLAADYPKATAAGEITGAVVGPGAVGAKVVSKAPTILTRILTGAGTGATSNAINAAATGEDPTRAALVGAAVGGGGQAIGETVSALAPVVKKAANTYGANTVEKTLKAAAQTPDKGDLSVGAIRNFWAKQYSREEVLNNPNLLMSYGAITEPSLAGAGWKALKDTALGTAGTGLASLTGPFAPYVAGAIGIKSIGNVAKDLAPVLGHNTVKFAPEINSALDVVKRTANAPGIPQTANALLQPRNAGSAPKYYDESKVSSQKFYDDAEVD